jgi:hypothetical protein
LLALFRRSDARARFPERPLAHHIAIIPLHAMGAGGYARSRPAVMYSEIQQEETEKTENKNS